MIGFTPKAALQLRALRRHSVDLERLEAVRNLSDAIDADALRWLKGEGLIARYDLPTAGSFATAFCRNCGSPLPHRTRSGRETIIPAGSFDDPLEQMPDRHVHWSSRAGWFRHGEDLPTEM